MPLLRPLIRVRMPVPPASALHPGVSVKIVLKADQRSGKLTSGRIADILTRGDHPRGVKVRLQDGQIGRVQSLSSLAETFKEESPAPTGPPVSTESSLALPDSQTPASYSTSGWQQGRGASRHRRGEYHDSYNSFPPPSEERSLGDYVVVKSPKRNRIRGGAAPSDPLNGEDIGADTALRTPQDQQQILQQEFPSIDSALIAAILNDGQPIEDARKVLSSLI